MEGKFQFSPEGRREFILAKFKLAANELLSKKDKETIIDFFLKRLEYFRFYRLSDA